MRIFLTDATPAESKAPAKTGTRFFTPLLALLAVGVLNIGCDRSVNDDSTFAVNMTLASFPFDDWESTVRQAGFPANRLDLDLSPPTRSRDRLPLLHQAAEARNSESFILRNHTVFLGGANHPDPYLNHILTSPISENPRLQQYLELLSQINSDDYLWMAQREPDVALYDIDLDDIEELEVAVRVLVNAGLLSLWEADNELGVQRLISARRWANAPMLDARFKAASIKLELHTIVQTGLNRYWEMCGISPTCVQGMQKILAEPINLDLSRSHRGEFLARLQQWQATRAALEERSRRFGLDPSVDENESSEFLSQMLEWHVEAQSIYDALDRGEAPSWEQIQFLTSNQAHEFTMTRSLGSRKAMVTRSEPQFIAQIATLHSRECMSHAMLAVIQSIVSDDIAFVNPHTVIAECKHPFVDEGPIAVVNEKYFRVMHPDTTLQDVMASLVSYSSSTTLVYWGLPRGNDGADFRRWLAEQKK